MKTVTDIVINPIWDGGGIQHLPYRKSALSPAT